MMKGIKLIGFVLLLCLSVHAQTFDSRSTGADGPFNPPGQAPAGTSALGDCTRAPGCTVTVPLRDAPNHVFNFTTVTIGPFVTVKFGRNAANTPVTILAQGDVTINGVIDVSGQNADRGIVAAQGGPGGFSGGIGAEPSGLTNIGGTGSGPGGGGGVGFTHGAGGSFGSSGDGFMVGPVYGIQEIIPLIGGSGGAGGAVSGGLLGGNGGGGGGGLLIASSTVIDLGTGSTNAIVANGGRGDNTPGPWAGGGGSGGAIRLVATTLRGSRRMVAAGETGGYSGGLGRIRLEAIRFQYNSSTYPTYSFGPPAAAVPPVTPAVRIVSVGGIAAPALPTSDINTPDVTVPANFTNPVTLALEATNVPSGTMARVILAPQLGSGGRTIAGPVALTGPAGQPKRATVTVTLPARGVGILSTVIDSTIAEP